MNSKRRIALLLTLVFLLPALFFSVYQWSSMDKDEQMIQEIYTKQLEAILFSVNQYSDDIITNWVVRFERGIQNDSFDHTSPGLHELLTLNPSLLGIFFANSEDSLAAPKVLTLAGTENDGVTGVDMGVSIRQQGAKIAELVRYKRSGFQKIEHIPLDTPGLNGVIFISEPRQDVLRIAGFVIDTELFIEDVIGPRLQAVARDKFVLSVIRKDGSSVYNTETLADSAEAEAVTKDLWIFPDYAVGIRTSGPTLQALVNERTSTNLLLLVGLDVILIIAVVLVFRNLKREVDLAQNKTEFVSNVSHEIRTPLAVISMFAETLEMNRITNEEKKQEYYQIISKETQRLSGIVNRILNFSQAETKTRVLRPEILQPGEVVRGLLQTYDFHLRNKGFEYSYSESGRMRIRADREAMEEVLINLIDNAMKYSTETKRIELTTSAEGLFAIVAIKDYGVGISQKDQRKIFDKFYRVSSGDLAKTRGTGLGLSLVSELMEALQGKVTVESEPGKGSTFKLYFQRV